MKYFILLTVTLLSLATNAKVYTKAKWSNQSNLIMMSEGQTCLLTGKGLQCKGKSNKFKFLPPDIKIQNPKHIASYHDGFLRYTCLIDDHGLRCYSLNIFNRGAGAGTLSNVHLPKSGENSFEKVFVGSNPSNHPSRHLICALSKSTNRCWNMYDGKARLGSVQGNVLDISLVYDEVSTTSINGNIDSDVYYESRKKIETSLVQDFKNHNIYLRDITPYGTCTVDIEYKINCFGFKDDELINKNKPTLSEPILEIKVHDNRACIRTYSGIICWGIEIGGLDIVKGTHNKWDFIVPNESEDSLCYIGVNSFCLSPVGYDDDFVRTELPDTLNMKESPYFNGKQNNERCRVENEKLICPKDREYPDRDRSHSWWMANPYSKAIRVLEHPDDNYNCVIHKNRYLKTDRRRYGKGSSLVYSEVALSCWGDGKIFIDSEIIDPDVAPNLKILFAYPRKGNCLISVEKENSQDLFGFKLHSAGYLRSRKFEGCMNMYSFVSNFKKQLESFLIGDLKVKKLLMGQRNSFGGSCILFEDNSFACDHPMLSQIEKVKDFHRNGDLDCVLFLDSSIKCWNWRRELKNIINDDLSLSKVYPKPFYAFHAESLDDLIGSSSIVYANYYTKIKEYFLSSAEELNSPMSSFLLMTALKPSVVLNSSQYFKEQIKSDFIDEFNFHKNLFEKNKRRISPIDRKLIYRILILSLNSVKPFFSGIEGEFFVNLNRKLTLAYTMPLSIELLNDVAYEFIKNENELAKLNQSHKSRSFYELINTLLELLKSKE